MVKKYFSDAHSFSKRFVIKRLEELIETEKKWFGALPQIDGEGR